MPETSLDVENFDDLIDSDRRRFLLCTSQAIVGLLLSGCYTSRPLLRSTNLIESASEQTLLKLRLGTLLLNFGCFPDAINAIGMGAGFFYDKHTIVTTAHGFDMGAHCLRDLYALVIDKNDNNFTPMSPYEAENNDNGYVIVRDDKEDLAIIYFKKPLSIASSAILEVANSAPSQDEKVVRCGHSLQNSWEIFQGTIINRVAGLMTVISNAPRRYLHNEYYQFAGVDFQGGNSGGPVVNTNGEVIGLAAGRWRSLLMLFR